MAALTTPYLFIPSVVREVVEPNRPGAYALGDDLNGFVVGYVGRSGACIQSRLTHHNHLYRFEYFIFRYANNAMDAFLIECQFWHACEKNRLKNIIHPASPRLVAIRCPYCEFAEQIAFIVDPGKPHSNHKHRGRTGKLLRP